MNRIFYFIINTSQLNNCQKTQKMRSSTNRFPTFIQKLIKMLQDQQCQQYIHWLPSQNGFNITNVSGFAQNALAAYFKHQNYSSFVRQLNMYGFTKVRSRDADNIYEHRNFKRGSRYNIKKIQRKSGLDSNPRNYQLVPYVSNQYKKHNELQKLKKSQTELQKKCTNLLQRNRQLLQKNEKIANAIKKQQQKKRQLFQQILQVMNSFNFQNQQSQHQLLSIQAEKQKAIYQSKQKLIGSKQNLQNIQNIAEDKQNPINLLDENQKFLSLDDFININYDQMSEGFKFQDQNY